MRVDWCVSSWFRIKNSLSLQGRRFRIARPLVCARAFSSTPLCSRPLISVAPPASPERLRFEVGLFCYLLESCECVRRRTLRRPCMVCVECCLWCFVGCVWGEGGREQRLPPHHACQARPPPSAAAAQASWPICLSRKRSAFLNSTTSSSSRPSRAMKAGERREGPLAEVA